MVKGFLRITIILTAFYFILSYIFAQYLGIDIMNDWYGVLFEAICVLVCFEDDSKYFCRFIKFTAIGLFVSDVITRLDNVFNFLNVTAHNFIPLAILAIGILTSTYKAIAHFIRVFKVTKRKNG